MSAGGLLRGSGLGGSGRLDAARGGKEGVKTASEGFSFVVGRVHCITSLCGWLGGDLRAVLDSVEDFFGEFEMGFGAAGSWVVEDGGFAVAGSFGQTDVAGDGGLIQQLPEEGLEFGGDSLGEVGAVVVHGEDDAFDDEAGIEGLADALDGIEQLADAFEGEVLGLHGDEDGVGCDEGVEGEKVERGRAIEDDDVKLVADGLQGVTQAVFAEFGVDELDIGADEMLGGRDDLELLEFRWVGEARRLRNLP